MTKCIGTSRKVGLVSGHFDGVHSGHLDYIEQAAEKCNHLICLISSDKQLMMKKGKVNNTEEERRYMVNLLLDGLGVSSKVYVNRHDTDTTFIAKALRHFKPDILFRGYDKAAESMPLEEHLACKELGIKIIYAKNRVGERHSSEVFEW